MRNFFNFAVNPARGTNFRNYCNSILGSKTFDDNSMHDDNMNPMSYWGASINKKSTFDRITRGDYQAFKLWEKVDNGKIHFLDSICIIGNSSFNVSASSTIWDDTGYSGVYSTPIIIKFRSKIMLKDYGGRSQRYTLVYNESEINFATRGLVRMRAFDEINSTEFVQYLIDNYGGYLHLNSDSSLLEESGLRIGDIDEN